MAAYRDCGEFEEARGKDTRRPHIWAPNENERGCLSFCWESVKGADTDTLGVWPTGSGTFWGRCL